jgi:capsular polysaccharide biosynthesis protein
MFPSSELRKVTVRDYLEVIRRRMWIIVAVIAISVIVAGFYSIFSPKIKIYMSTTNVLVEEHPVLKTAAVKGVPAAKIQQRDMSVLLEHMRSRSFAGRVAKRMGRTDPHRILSMVSVQQYRDRRTGRETNIITVSARGTNPVEITDVANAWVEELIRTDIETKKDITEYGGDSKQSEGLSEIARQKGGDRRPYPGIVAQI